MRINQLLPLRSKNNRASSSQIINSKTNLPNNSRSLLARFLCLLLVFSLLATSAPAAAAQTIVRSSAEKVQDVRYAFLSSDLTGKSWAAEIGSWFGFKSTGGQNLQRADAQVARVEISPGSVTVNQGEQVFFIAVGYDSEGKTLSGVPFKWMQRQTDSDRPETNFADGRFVAKRAGIFEIAAEANGVRGQVTVTVNAVPFALRKEGRELASENSSGIVSSTREDTENTGEPAQDNQREANPSGDGPVSNLLPIGGWDDTNWPSADNYTSQVGNAPGGPSDGGAHSGNFQIDVPLVSLPGRGLDVNLNMTYNARLWHKSGNSITYDIDAGFPGPGWSLGYGKMVHTGSRNGRCLLIGGDGTRHSVTGTTTPYGTTDWTSTYNGHTTDGSLMDFSCTATNSGAINGNWVKTPDGATITYGAANGFESYPVRITDAQGNYITITYKNNQGPRIETITDTVGRNIQFYYGAGNRLYHIYTKGVGGVDRLLVQFHYRQIQIVPSFNGLNATVRDNNYSPFVLDAIVYSPTLSGYRFDSYSSYGMITKVEKRRGIAMVLPDDGNNPWSVQIGALTSQTEYNYPLSPAGLTDAPMYTTRTDTWEYMTTPPSVTTYVVDNNSNPRRTEVIDPLGTKTVQYTPGAGQPTEGWVTKTEVYNPGGGLLGSTTSNWQMGVYASPRLTQVQSTDERNQTKRVEYGYENGNFNQVTAVREYGYAGELLRRTSSTYENGTNYIGQLTGGIHTGNHVYNLLKMTETFDPNNVRMSRTEYEYDNNYDINLNNHNLANAPGVIGFEQSHNPYNTDICIGCDPTVCLQWQQYQCGQTTWCTRCVQYGNLPIYQRKTNFRGNVTKTRTYTNASNLTGAIEHSMQYDITGNPVKINTSCCEQMSFTYDPYFQYAYPTSKTRGSATDAAAQVTTYANYDKSTGLQISSTDANGLVSTVQYNQYNLRVERENSPTGAYTEYAYNDVQMYVVTSSKDSGGAVVGQSVDYFNGLGKLRTQVAYGPNLEYGDSVSQVQYDQLGRVKRQSLPHRLGTDSQSSENFYDALGRVYKTQAPDGSTAEVFYNEAARPDTASGAAGQTVRTRDAWGRERWSRSDALGRLVEVVEPNPGGNGSVMYGYSLATQYYYDALDQLTLVTQGQQTRWFMYDSLGRLTRQKLAEQTGTINDAGQYVGPGIPGQSRWSEAFTYDDRSNLTQKTDARGVKTNYIYNNDPLNRLQKVEYDKLGADQPNTIADASDFNLFYMTTGDKTRIYQVQAWWTTEQNDYDAQGRIKDYTMILLPSGTSLTTSYLYDTVNRVTEIRYPAQYGMPGNPRKIVTPGYENNTGRLRELRVDNQIQMSEIVYNPLDQVTSLKIGAGTSNPDLEQYAYDPQNGLLTNQKVVKANTGQKLLDLSYEYGRGGSIGTLNGKTGAVSQVINNLDRNKDRTYTYDALGRLTKASGGANLAWTQEYAYDRYGNRLSVTASGFEAMRGSGTTTAELKNTVPGNGAGGGKRETNGVSLNLSSAQPQTSQTQSPGQSGVAAMMPPSAEQLVANVNDLFKQPSAKGGPRESSNEESGASTAPTSSDKQTTDESLPASTDSETNRITENKTADAKSGIKLENDAAIENGSAMLNPPSNRTPFDFTGDGLADPSIFNRSTATWTVKGSGTGQITTQQLGAAGDQIAPGDYDGDGKTDHAVWTPNTGTWKIKPSATGVTYTTQFGAKGDSIVPADYDGDGKTDIAVWRPSTGYWYIYKSATGTITEQWWGSAAEGDIPAPGDYDGDGKADFMVWRPTNGTWYLIRSSDGVQGSLQYGDPGDVPVPADYDGNNITDFAVWRPSNGTWYFKSSTTYVNFEIPMSWSNANDIPVPANYDGAPGAEAAVWRPSDGTFYVLRVSDGTIFTIPLGSRGDVPVESAYIRRSSGPIRQSAEIQRDGLASVAYDAASNRITTPGFQYDLAGNLTRSLTTDGAAWQRCQYDAAGRMKTVTDDSGNVVKQDNGFTSSNQRLFRNEPNGSGITWYVWEGEQVVAEYTSQEWNTSLTWSKSYIYAGSRLLSTYTNNGQGGQTQEFHHADRLGTRLVTNNQANTSFEQTTLPYGNVLQSETSGVTNQPFTSYDRSQASGLDYANNRTYDSGQGRFTQVDPLQMGAANAFNPQSMNLYAYVENDPINFVDPSGLNLSPVLYNCTNLYAADGGQYLGTVCQVHWTTDPNAGIGESGSGGGESGGGGGTSQTGQQGQQQRANDKYSDCVKKAGIDGNVFNQDAANFVLSISAAEGTAPNLLAYTWGRESSFEMNPVPNTNDSTDTGRWDYGPFQLNAYWIGKAIAKGQVSTDGINIGDALGGHTVRAGKPFAGDPYENGRLAARYLNSLGTGRDAAGKFTGGSRVADRSKGFDEWGPKFQKLFDCLRK